MAQRIIHQLVDDLDGTVLEVGEGETVRFGIDGRGYEIDLSSANAEQLHEVLAPFIAAGRKSQGSQAPSGRSRSSKRDVDAIRVWARENGHEISDRGRIPLEIERAYNAR